VTQYTETHSGREPARSGFAIASLVSGVVGMCLLFIGPILAIVVGVASLVSNRGKADAGVPNGLSIAGLALGGIGIVFSFYALAVLPGTLSRAREVAFRVESAANMGSIVQSLNAYTNDGNPFPPVDDWEQTLIRDNVVDPEWLEPRAAEEAGVSTAYFLVPPGTIDARTGNVTNVVLYEHPALHEDGGQVAYANADVEFMREPAYSEVIDNLEDAKGNAYAPHLAPGSAAP
jgi:hypothetical protein